MKSVKAEAIKFFKASYFWVFAAVHLVLLFFLFLNYTKNPSSRLFEPKFRDPINLASFFLLLFSNSVSGIFAVSLGARIGGKEYSDGSITHMIQLSGRLRAYGAKIILLFFICLGTVMALVLWGIGLGLFYGESVTPFVPGEMLKRMLTAFVCLFLLSLASLAVSMALKSSSKGMIVCIIFLVLQNFLPQTVSQYLDYLNPSYYVSAFLDGVFSNIKGTIVEFGSFNTHAPLLNVLFLTAYLAVVLFIIFMMAKRREFSR